jgi:putative ABC transport system permease protein
VVSGKGGGNLTFFIVKKYLSFDKNQPFISISAILAFLGVMLGVAVLMIAMAIMNGFSKEFKEKLFTMNYPLTIYSKTYNKINDNDVKNLQKQFPNLLFSPYITTNAMVKKGDNLQGVKLFGVDFELEKKINKVFKKAVNEKQSGKFEVVIGKELKENLFIQEGDRLILIFTNTTPAGLSLIPKMKRFKVHSTFESGLSAYDKAYMYTSLNSLGKIVGSGTKYNGIHVYSKTPQEDIKTIQQVLPEHLGVIGWWQQNGNFFAAIKMEETVMFIVLMLIIIVASLNIISSLLMTVMSRRNEIALLISLGASAKQVKQIFFRLGIIIGGGGAFLGVLLGFLGIFILGNFDIVDIPKDVYPTNTLPLDLSLSAFLYILLGTGIVVVLSSYYPAKKASEVDVLKTLRHE